MSLDVDAIRQQRPQNDICYFPIIDSTMIEAARMAATGRPNGTVVIADQQTAGVGRLGRQWISEPDVGIYCSILLRLPVVTRELPLTTLALGLATAEAIQQSTRLACDLRWPNDVLVSERKVAGILAQWHDGCIVAGVGINVNQEKLPDDLRTPAASLRMLLGRQILREPLVVHLLKAVDEFSAMLVERGAAAILNSFANASSYVLHRRVLYETETGLKRGVTYGLDNNGFLKVKDEQGVIHTLYTGGVRPDTGQI